MRNILLVLSTLSLLLLSIFSYSCIYISGQSLEVRLTPRIQRFEALPSTVNIGESTYLQWQVTGADTVSINNGIGPVASNGTMPVSPQDTTFYILTARNSMGEINAMFIATFS